MSVEAITWALSLPVAKSSMKFVLVALANCANSDLECWPSIKYLADATSQDRKTVLENMRRLAVAGLIEQTEGRRGATKQIVVYRLIQQAQKRDCPEIGTVPKFPAKSTEIPPKQSRFSVETGPKTGHGTVKNHKEPSRKKDKAAPQGVAVSLLVAAGFDEPTAVEFIACKLARKAPLTPRAWADHLAEARKAGWTPQAAAEKVMAKTWKGFEAKYVADEPAPAAARRAQVVAEPPWRTEQRSRMREFLGPAAGPDPFTVEMEKPHAAKRLG